VEAARTFDRANLFLRGNRGKLNYSYSDYVDAEGHLIQDPKLFVSRAGRWAGSGGSSSHGWCKESARHGEQGRRGFHVACRWCCVFQPGPAASLPSNWNICIEHA
jgi:hypothetical protein